MRYWQTAAVVWALFAIAAPSRGERYAYMFASSMALVGVIWTQDGRQ